MTKYNKSDIGPFIKNKDNLMPLLDWLLHGAPHTVFNIEYSAVRKGDEWIGNAFGESLDIHENQTFETCGSVCCIAGAACQMHLGEFGKITDLKTYYMTWEDMQDNAAEYLGIDVEGHHMWPIFNPDVWRSKPTGPECAAALVEFSKSGNEWDAIKVVENSRDGTAADDNG